MLALAFGVADEPIDTVRIPPVIVNAIELVDVAELGANLAATLKAPPSIRNMEPLFHCIELFEVPTLYVPADILNRPESEGELFCPTTV